jgi:hypothetical protein
MENLPGKFQLVRHQDLHKALSDDHYSVDDLETTALKDVRVEGNSVPVIGLGRFCLRTGRVVTLQCNLVGTETREQLATVGGTAFLNESEWARTGSSVRVEPEDWPPPAAPPLDGPLRPGAQTGAVIPRLDQRAARERHPLSDPQFPYRVRIMVNGRERRGTAVGNDWYVSLSKGEVYQIRVENRDQDRVFLRLLVDGLNTLPDKPAAKDIAVEPAGAKPTRLPAQRVNLDEAFPWLLEPSGQGQTARPYAIKGFYSKTGEPAEWNEFEVVDAAMSVAAHRQFTDQIGLITAAFYSFVGTRGGPGTGFGKRQTGTTAQYKYREEDVGRLLAVVNIHYVEPKDLPKLQAAARR